MKSSVHFRRALRDLSASALGLLAVAACQRAQAPASSAQAEPRAPVAITSGAAPRVYAKPPEAELEQRLTPLEYEVTQHAGTEAPFHNEFWDNHQAGLYVDIVTGEPLFSSTDKFESGTGWPSFTRPVDPNRVVTREDSSLGMSRTEVRSKSGASHLGHLFDDGPAPTGQRYCINSAALRFIPLRDLEKEGYGEYLPLFGAAPGKARPVASGPSASPAASAARAN